MPISIASRKAKARSLQQWVCKKVSELIGCEWGVDMPVESRPMGQTGCDVRLDAHAQRLLPFSVECKFQESWSVPAWIEQAKANRKEGTDWLLVAKRSREAPVVILDAEVFFETLSSTTGINNLRLSAKQ